MAASCETRGKQGPATASPRGSRPGRQLSPSADRQDPRSRQVRRPSPHVRQRTPGHPGGGSFQQTQRRPRPCVRAAAVSSRSVCASHAALHPKPPISVPHLRARWGCSHHSCPVCPQRCRRLSPTYQSMMAPFLASTGYPLPRVSAALAALPGVSAVATSDFTTRSGTFHDVPPAAMQRAWSQERATGSLTPHDGCACVSLSPCVPSFKSQVTSGSGAPVCTSKSKVTSSPSRNSLWTSSRALR